MTLYATPVTQADIEALQLGIGFFTDPTAAASEVAAINAATPGGPTVYSYAVQLLASQIRLMLTGVQLSFTARRLGWCCWWADATGSGRWGLNIRQLTLTR